MANDAYPWTRRESESHQAYEAFRDYLTSRSLRDTCKNLGKAESLIKRWCKAHSWVERVTAYDSFMTEQETDGLVHALAETRDKNLALADKLRGHLSNRLDEFIQKGLDPSVRWTQALVALTRVDAAVFANVDDKKTEEKLDRVTALLERLDEMRSGETLTP